MCTVLKGMLAHTPDEGGALALQLVLLRLQLRQLGVQSAP